MARACMLITKPPHSDEGAERICGISQRAKELDFEVAVYLLGDGVLCAKKGQSGHVGQNIRLALDNGIIVKASSRDLRARAIHEDDVESGVELLDDLEGAFVEDMMEHADRVISW